MWWGSAVGMTRHDEELVARVRALLAGEPDLEERRMFGGLAFLVGGSMAVAASGQGGLMVRLDPERADAAVAAGEAGPLEMRGRPVRGWVRVDTDAVRGEDALAGWVGLGVARARAVGGLG